MKLLVTGGAGYIGSVLSRHLLEAGHTVWVLDNLERGHRAAIAPEATFVEADLRDGSATDAVLSEGFDGVLHLAAFALVAESVADPGRYYTNNVLGTLNLLEAMVRHGVPRLVFSSTCAVYGVPAVVPIEESSPTRPINAYGASKLAADHVIRDHCTAFGLAGVSLRYFNVAGAHGEVGEVHEPETHLIPNALGVALGRSAAVDVFGTDYPTPDGTAVRDYVHVDDLAVAHGLALEGARPGVHAVYNLGNGRGFSVREVIAAVERVTGVPVPAQDRPRRPGDPPELVAAAERIGRELGWTSQKPSLDGMVAEAWAFLQAHPGGYR